MKKWGSGSILDFQNQSSDDGLKKVKFSDDDQVPAFQSAYHVATQIKRNELTKTKLQIKDLLPDEINTAEDKHLNSLDLSRKAFLA